MVLALILALFVFVLGPTVLILNLLPTTIGAYVSDLAQMSARTGASSNPETGAWLSSWTIFYWAWWVSWTPFVGMFIARISRGRTIRQFIRQDGKWLERHVQNGQFINLPATWDVATGTGTVVAIGVRGGFGAGQPFDQALHVVIAVAAHTGGQVKFEVAGTAGCQGDRVDGATRRAARSALEPR